MDTTTVKKVIGWSILTTLLAVLVYGTVESVGGPMTILFFSIATLVTMLISVALFLIAGD